MPLTEPSKARLFDQIDIEPVLSQLGDMQSGWFMIKDREHRFQLVSQRFADVLGRSREDIIGFTDVEVGIPHALLFGDPENGVPGVRTRDEECMSTGIPTRYSETAVNLGEEQFDAILAIRTPLRNNKGEVIGLIIQALDQTSLSQLESQIEAANVTASVLDEKLSTLDSLLAELLICHDRNELCQKITDTLVSQTLADGAYVAVLQEPGDHLEIIAASGRNPEQQLGLTYRPNEGLIGRAWATRDMVYTDDAVASGATQAFDTSTQLCALPIWDGDEVVAVMSATLSMDIEKNLKTDIPTLQRILRISGIALANARLLQTTRKALKQTSTMADFSRQLATVDRLDDACAMVCEAMLHMLDVCATGAVLMDDKGKVSTVVSRRSDSPTVLEKDLPNLRKLARSCYDIGGAISYGPVAEPDAIAHLASPITSQNGCSAFALPLLNDGKFIGVLAVLKTPRRRPLGAGELDVFTTVVNQLGTTLERQELSMALRHQAFHDRLTNLPNRHRFESELQQMLDNDEAGALLFIDLDGFKYVNDTLGHGIGDQLLQLVAKRLQANLKPADIPARMGGDEFAVILPIVSDNNEALNCGKRVLNALEKAFVIDTQRINISASVGLSRFPEDGDSVDTLLRNADVAMYQAKQSGKGRLLSFDESLAAELRNRTQLQTDLLIAIERDEFELFYQPQVCCLSGQVTGVEALLRWIHPKRGPVSPAEFIPIAEHAGLINDIGTWVVNSASQQIGEWQTTALRNLRVSINIAATQFQQENFSELVFDSLAHHNAPTDRLEIEVTESVIMNDVATVVKRLKTLREAGIRIAIDDFGTGYSSLSYLQDLPLDVLKIDRAFVSRLQNERSDQSVANTIVLLATGLGLDTVAEGVETEEQRDAIVAIGCNTIQGYYFSPPVSADDLPSVIEQTYPIKETLRRAS